MDQACRMIEAHQDALFAIPGVNAVGYGEPQGRPAIVVMHETEEHPAGIPNTLSHEGLTLPVVVEYVGTIRPL